MMIANFHLVIVTLIYFFRAVSGLICYHCKADSEEKCHASETRRECREFQDACLHIRYSYHHKLANGSFVVKHEYNKRCIISVHGECSLYCKDVWRRGAIECKQHCCSHRNFCNVGYIERQDYMISSSWRLGKTIRLLLILLVISAITILTSYQLAS